MVTIVDQYGRATDGFMELYGADGTYQSENGAASPVVGPTHTFTVPGAAGYAMELITPWSGITCLGVAPCSTAPTSFTPVLTVGDGQSVTYTAHVTVPSITGNGTVGSPLTVQIPDGLNTLQAAVAAAGGPYAGLSVLPTQQWLRGATDITGATASSYTTTRDDGGQSVAARLTPGSGTYAVFGPTGLTVSPFTTNSIAVAKTAPLATKTKAKVAKRLKVGEKVTMTVKVTAATGTPDGDVTVKIGKFKTRKTLKGGSVLVNLPRLGAGTYKVKTSYAGSADFTASKSKTTRITVTK